MASVAGLAHAGGVSFYLAWRIGMFRRFMVLFGVVAVAVVVAGSASLHGSGVATAKASTRQSASVRVPGVVGKRLDIAEAMLRLRGLRPVEHGGGFFGIIVKHNWQVCFQSPAGGKVIRSRGAVSLYAARPGQC
jgi:hypothetical protein